MSDRKLPILRLSTDFLRGHSAPRVSTLCLLCFAFFVPSFGNSLAAEEGQWVDARQSGRFVVRSEFPIDRQPQLAEFLDHLDQHEADIEATLGLSVADSPIEINLFAGKRSYQRAIQAEAPEAIRRQALFIQKPNGGQVFAYAHAGLLTDLRHESTHAILHSSLPFLPLWLDEGLAEYFEVPATERASGHPHLQRIQWNIRLGGRFDLTRLEKLDTLKDMDALDYRESWAWVHYLLHGPDEATEVLKAYLHEIEEHQPPGPLSARLKARFGQVEKNLPSHFKAWR